VAAGISFFEIKGRSTAISFKKKKQLYITSRSEHHHHNNTREQLTQQNSTPPQPGREGTKEATKNCAVVANAVPQQKSRPAASLSDNSNSSATGKQP
jgi:hypothetical protein